MHEAFLFAEVCHQPYNQIVSELGAVDHLSREVVWHRVKNIRHVDLYGYCSATGFALVEKRDHPSRNWEQGRGAGVPLFEAVLGGASALHLHDIQNSRVESAPESSLLGKAAR